MTKLRDIQMPSTTDMFNRELGESFNPKTAPPLPEPVPPTRLEQLTDHIETSTWPEVLGVAVLIIIIGMALGILLAL